MLLHVQFLVLATNQFNRLRDAQTWSLSRLLLVINLTTVWLCVTCATALGKALHLLPFVILSVLDESTSKFKWKSRKAKVKVLRTFVSLSFLRSLNFTHKKLAKNLFHHEMKLQMAKRSEQEDVSANDAQTGPEHFPGIFCKKAQQQVVQCSGFGSVSAISLLRPGRFCARVRASAHGAEAVKLAVSSPGCCGYKRLSP